MPFGTIRDLPDDFDLVADLRCLRAETPTSPLTEAVLREAERPLYSNAPAGPGKTTGLSLPSRATDETPKKWLSITTFSSV